MRVSRALLAIVVLAALPYVTALGGDFVYDDVALCRDDPRVVEGDVAGALSGPYWGKRHGGLYRPVTTLSYVANARVSRGPLGFRLVNVALHVGASALALALARRLLGSERAAFLAAAVFAVHPVHVEVAGNVVGRAESLGFLLGGGAWLLAVPAARDRRPGALLAATALAVLGVLAKENALGVALGAPLELLVLPGRERAGGGGFFSRSRLETLALAVAPAAVALALGLAARLLALGPEALTPASRGIPWVMNPLAEAGLANRAANAPLLLLEYARHFVWPARLAPDYAGFYLPLATSPREGKVVGWFLGATLLVVAPALIARERARAAAFASLFALLSLGPVLQLVPIGTLLGDRLLYSASFGWSLLAGLGGAAALRRVPDSRGKLGAALVVGALAAVATSEALAWRSNIPLFQRAWARTKGTLQIPLVLGSFLNEAGRYDEARAPLREALQLRPEEGGAHLVLGNLERLTKNYRVAKVELERGLALPHFPEDEPAAFYDLGDTLYHLGDDAGAERAFARACELAPDGKNLAALGGVLWLRGDRTRALATLDRSLAIDPDQEKAADVRALRDRIARGEEPPKR